MTAPDSSHRLALGGALLATLALAAPFFFGDGVDVPDDALYSTVSTWEALRHAVRSGESIWWIPYRMGGASLYTEAMQMGPFYPAMWPAFVLPVSVALPLAFFVHSLGTLFSVRWAARGFGVGPTAATLAGAAVVLGPLGAAVYIECQTDTWPVILWLPVVLGALHRADRAEGRERWGWVGVGGLALGLMLLGAHIRHCAGACGALGLWFLLRGGGAAGLARAGVLTLLGLAIGSLAWLPGTLEWREAAAGGGMMPMMSVPPYQSLRWTALASWLAPKPLVTAREFALGTVLATAFLYGAFVRSAVGVRRSGADPAVLKRLSILVGVLLFIAADLPIPVLSYLWLPFKLLAHPVTILYYAVAMIPAAIVAAAGIEHLVDDGDGAFAALTRGRVGALLGVLVVALVLRVVLGTTTLASAYEWAIYSVGAVQAAAVLGGVAWVLRNTAGPRRMRLLVLIALLDLAVFGVRYHTAIPSRPLNLAARGVGVDLEALRGGYLNIQEAVALEQDGLQFIGHLQTATAGRQEGLLDEYGDAIDYDEEGGEVEILEEEAPMIQAELLRRRWPVHIGARYGFRSLSGRVKLPPARAVVMLVPLVEALAPQWEGDPYESDIRFYPAENRAFLDDLFGDPDGVGARTLALHGIRAAVGDLTPTYTIDPIVPRCYSPSRFAVEPHPGRRVRRLVKQTFGPDVPALLETGPPPVAEGAAARVVCNPDGYAVRVAAEVPSMVVLRERHHSGWRVVADSGATYTPVPVNQVHMGVVVPPGEDIVRWRFVPPGVVPAGVAGGVGGIVALGLIAGLRRRRDD